MQILGLTKDLLNGNVCGLAQQSVPISPPGTLVSIQVSELLPEQKGFERAIKTMFKCTVNVTNSPSLFAFLCPSVKSGYHSPLRTALRMKSDLHRQPENARIVPADQRSPA